MAGGSADWNKLNDSVDHLNKNIESLNEKVGTLKNSIDNVELSIKKLDSSTEKYNKRMLLANIGIILIAVLTLFVAGATFYIANQQLYFGKQIEHQREIGLLEGLLREYRFNMSIYKPVAEDRQYIDGKMGVQLQKFNDFAFLNCKNAGVIDNEKLYNELERAYNLFTISNVLFDKIRAMDKSDQTTRSLNYAIHTQNYFANKQLFTDIDNMLDGYIKNKSREK